MTRVSMYRHVPLTASQQAEDDACPDGAPDVELCDCGEVATCKIGTTPVCSACNLVIAIDETGVRADYAECEGAD